MNRAFGPSYLRRYESPKKDSKNDLYRNVIMTNALVGGAIGLPCNARGMSK
jgi:hypothetical protein